MERWIVIIVLVVLSIVAAVKGERDQRDILWHVVCIVSTAFLMFTLMLQIVEAYAEISTILFWG